MKDDSKKLKISQINISVQPSLLSTRRKLDPKTDCSISDRHWNSFYLSFNGVSSIVGIVGCSFE